MKILSVEPSPDYGKIIIINLDHSVRDDMIDKSGCLTTHKLKEDDFYDILRSLGISTNPCPVMQLMDKEKFDKLYYAIIGKEQKFMSKLLKEVKDDDEEI